jgi:hypothetical protein
MTKLTDFKKFVLESNDDREELRNMGFSELPDMEFNQRFQAMTDEWSSDPEVSQALDILKRKTNEILDKWIDYDQDQADWEEIQGQIANDFSLDEIGFLEYMIASGNF